MRLLGTDQHFGGGCSKTAAKSKILDWKVKTGS